MSTSNSKKRPLENAKSSKQEPKKQKKDSQVLQLGKYHSIPLSHDSQLYELLQQQDKDALLKYTRIFDRFKKRGTDVRDKDYEWKEGDEIYGREYLEMPEAIQILQNVIQSNSILFWTPNPTTTAKTLYNTLVDVVYEMMKICITALQSEKPFNVACKFGRADFFETLLPNWRNLLQSLRVFEETGETNIAKLEQSKSKRAQTKQKNVEVE